MQNKRPIAFLSQAFGVKNMLSIYEKELLALVTAMSKWRHCLEGHHFMIKTYHQSLEYLLEQKVTTSMQQKWLTKLLELSYEIQYKVGSENTVVDCLSRRVEDEVQCHVVSNQIIPAWISEVIAAI